MPANLIIVLLFLSSVWLVTPLWPAYKSCLSLTSCITIGSLLLLLRWYCCCVAAGDSCLVVRVGVHKDGRIWLKCFIFFKLCEQVLRRTLVKSMFDLVRWIIFITTERGSRRPLPQWRVLHLLEIWRVHKLRAISSFLDLQHTNSLLLFFINSASTIRQVCCSGSISAIAVIGDQRLCNGRYVGAVDLHFAARFLELGRFLRVLATWTGLDRHERQWRHFVFLLVKWLLIHHKYRLDSKNDGRTRSGLFDETLLGRALAFGLELGRGWLFGNRKLARGLRTDAIVSCVVWDGEPLGGVRGMLWWFLRFLLHSSSIMIQLILFGKTLMW